MSSDELNDIDVSYLGELRSLVRSMADGRFKTQPDVNRAFLSLRSYLLRLRRDFYGFRPEIRKFIDETLQVPVGTVTPSGMQRVGKGYLTAIKEFETMIGEREMDSLFRE